MNAPYRIDVARTEFKFSCAHMTVFPDGSKERMHGHNYYLGLAVELRDIAFEKMIAFAHIKDAATGLCKRWKEHLFVAAQNPYFELIRDEAEGEFEFRLCGERYILPRRDVILLPIDNIAVEPLAAYAADLLISELATSLMPDVVTALEVQVSEVPGQGATCRRELPA